MKKFFEDKRRKLEEGCEKCSGDVEAVQQDAPAAVSDGLTIFDLPASADPSAIPDGFTAVTGTDGKSYLIPSDALKQL